MSRWANKDIREQREKIVIKKYLSGWRVKDIASHIGIATGSVSHIIKTHLERRTSDISTARE